MAEGFAAVRQEMAQQRVELLKWAFVFWMGQFVAMVGLAPSITVSTYALDTAHRC